MTEIATIPCYSHGNMKLVDSEIGELHTADSACGDKNDKESFGTFSNTSPSISDDCKMEKFSNSRNHVQENEGSNNRDSIQDRGSSATDSCAVDSPDSNLKQRGFDKDEDVVCDEKDDAQADPKLDESFVDLLDISKGFDEGRCKKVGQYILGRTIGEGSYGKVRLATHLLSKQRVAVKVVAKKTLVQNEAARRHFRREALMLQRLHHPHVTRLYQALETGNCYYLVFELVVGGSLLHVLSRHGNFSEHRSRHYMRQIVSALDHLHKSDIVHRDLKLENILLDEHSNVKLVDFGLSAVCQDSNSALSTQCGSPLYAAPELFAGRKYGKPVDVWSLGVCFYALLAGCLPFLPQEGASLLQLYSLILKGCEIPENLSSSCKELLSGMLEVHESRRLSLDDVLSHPWLTKPLFDAGKELQPIKRVPPLPKQLNEMSVDFGVVKYICTMFRFSERDVVASVVSRKLTPAAATYHIINDSIESGRMSISNSREVTGSGKWSNKETKSAPASLPGKKVNAHSSVNHVLPDTQDQRSNVNLRQGESITSLQEDGREFGACEISTHDKLHIRNGASTTLEFGVFTGNACSLSESSTRRTTSESTDSGVGVDLSPEELKTGAHEPLESTEPNPTLKRQFSYKSFIVNLRQSRQKFKPKNGSNTLNGEGAEKSKRDGDQYVILGHSPRSRITFDEDSKEDKDKSIHAENKQSKSLDLPALSASRSGSFSPTFPPIACAVSSPSSHSPSSSSPVYSTISGLGQQCVKYNTFINSVGNAAGGNFYYSSKPIPGFRHGNRYFLHLDKSNFTACNMNVTGTPSLAEENDRQTCENFTPKHFTGPKPEANKLHNVRDTIFYPVIKPYSERTPPPPPNSQSCSPFSYLSGEKIELKTVGVEGKYMGPNNLLHSPTLRIRTNNSSLQIKQLHTSSNNTNRERQIHSNSGFYRIYSHTDVNTDVDTQQASLVTSTSVQHHRQPVRILASLRDVYGLDPWKKSKFKQYSANAYDASQPVRNSALNSNERERSRKKSHSKSKKGDDFPSMRLDVPGRQDGDESSRPRSNVSTPIASEREDFMMPVTSVIIRTIGRP